MVESIFGISRVKNCFISTSFWWLHTNFRYSFMIAIDWRPSWSSIFQFVRICWFVYSCRMTNWMPYDLFCVFVLIQKSKVTMKNQKFVFKNVQDKCGIWLSLIHIWKICSIILPAQGGNGYPTAVMVLLSILENLPMLWNGEVALLTVGSPWILRYGDALLATDHCSFLPSHTQERDA